MLRWTLACKILQLIKQSGSLRGLLKLHRHQLPPSRQVRILTCFCPAITSLHLKLRTMKSCQTLGQTAMLLVLTRIKARKDHKLDRKVFLLLKSRRWKHSNLQKMRNSLTMLILESLLNHLQSKMFLVKEPLVKCLKLIWNRSQKNFMLWRSWGKIFS